MSAPHSQMHSKVMTHRYTCERNPTYPRYILIDTSIKNNLHQTGSTIDQYPTCTKAGHWVIRQSFKQQVEIIYKFEINTICTTLGNKLTFLNVANGKAVCRMSQNFSTFSFYKMLVLQLCLRPSPFCVGHAQSRLSQNWFKSTTNQAQ